MVPHTDTARLFAGMPIVMRKIAQPRHDGIEHRDIDELPFASLFPLVEREQMPIAAYMPDAISAMAMPARAGLSGYPVVAMMPPSP